MTAVATGTADDYVDLLDELRQFLTSDSTLVAASEEWTELEWEDVPGEAGEKHLLLRGPGLGEADEIFVGLRTFSNPGADWFNWELRGYTGYVDGNAWSEQPGSSPSVSLLLRDSPIPYWFVANGRRFIVIAHVSTVYESAYAGLILPYATPQQYPYPIAVGASHAGRADVRFSDESNAHRFPWRGPHQASGQRMLTRFVDGSWRHYQVHRFVGGSDIDQIRPLNDNADYALDPLILFDDDNIIGELDGVYHVTGFGLAVEDTVTEDSVDHIAVQDIFRTGLNDFVAVRLE